MDPETAVQQLIDSLGQHGLPLDSSAVDLVRAWPDEMTRAGLPRRELYDEAEGRTEHRAIVDRLSTVGPFLRAAARLRGVQSIDAAILRSLISVMDSGTRHCTA